MKKKLVLHRETLRVLSGQGLTEIRGAANSLNPEEIDCQRDLTIPISGCQLCGPGTASANNCPTTVLPSVGTNCLC